MARGEVSATSKLDIEPCIHKVITPKPPLAVETDMNLRTGPLCEGYGDELLVILIEITKRCGHLFVGSRAIV